MSAETAKKKTKDRYAKLHKAFEMGVYEESLFGETNSLKAGSKSRVKETQAKFFTKIKPVHVNNLLPSGIPY